jgi:hypothetical protein
VVDAVSVGILIKKTRTFAELRATRDKLVLYVLLSRIAEHPRIVKVLRTSANRAAHAIELRSPADVDKEVRSWLTEAYVSSKAD